MERFESKLDGISINGMFYDATSLTRTTKNLRQRVNTMGKPGTIQLTPEYGFTLVIPLKENPLENPNLENLDRFDAQAFHTNGTIEVFPNCEVLSASESGNSTSAENAMTYEIACDKPY